MKLNWNNPVVVITGASSGIGKATALRFADEGARLVLAARRKNLLDELAEQCEERGAEAIAVETDVCKERDVQKLAKAAIKEFGQIDVWINNAGVSAIGRFDEIPIEDNEQVIKINLLGVMYGSSTALRHFRERNAGVLINVASALAQQAAPYQAAYVASKHAVRGLDDAIRQELLVNGESDIHVCTVMPVSMNTPLFRHAANYSGHKAQAIPPVYDPERVAETIVELAWNPQREVIVGTSGRLLTAQQKLSPELTERQLAKLTHRRQIERSPRERTRSGNLFRPMREGSEVHDEWAHSGEYANRAGAVLAAAVPVAAALWMWRRAQRPTRETQAA
jgi:short-subunit dehydrogenase